MVEHFFVKFGDSSYVICRSTLRHSRSRPYKADLKCLVCPSVCLFVRPYIRMYVVHKTLLWFQWNLTCR